jgi:hypothetical protein
MHGTTGSTAKEAHITQLVMEGALTVCEETVWDNPIGWDLQI